MVKCQPAKLFVFQVLGVDYRAKSVEAMLRYQNKRGWPRHFYMEPNGSLVVCRGTSLCSECKKEQLNSIEALNWKLYQTNKLMLNRVLSGSTTEIVCKKMLRRGRVSRSISGGNGVDGSGGNGGGVKVSCGGIDGDSGGGTSSLVRIDPSKSTTSPLTPPPSPTY